MLYDAHNHLQAEKLAPHLLEIEQQLERIGLEKAVVNGTKESNWARVAALAEVHKWVIPSFGLHPWFLSDRTREWRDRLTRLVETTPHAVVGEIGLDRAAGLADLEDQKAIFLWQLELAARLNVPATIHCVKAWGALWDILRVEPVPECGFLLHGYAGPVEMVEPFAKRGAYFSFCGSYLHEAKTARQDIFRAIPEDRLLVETDAPDMPLPPERVIYPIPGLNHPANIQAVYDGLAEVRGLPLHQLSAQVARNFQRLFGNR